MVRLEVYVEAACPSCAASLAVANAARDRFPELEVAVIDLTTASHSRAAVTATPTFLLDGRVVSLGNPAPYELERAIAEVLGGAP
jgi:predicted thioredoxin/glutaredoxin